jgi:predicted small lipoprotein YifL
MRWIFIGLISLQAATCGQKGPLRVPDSAAVAVVAVSASAR